jgi:hypothetical protein
MANVQDLHAVLAMRGINEEATRNLIIVREGLTQLGDLGVLQTDTDITEMPKRL